jgi:molybdopterin-guanine dinucleotide biosynthesis protein A
MDESVVARIDPEGRSFFNVNTQAELARFRALLQNGSSD